MTIALHKTLVKRVGEINVFLVDGFTVRNRFWTDFTQGGHDLVYKWIPEKEIWIDNDVRASERPYIIMHESIERQLMSNGLSYVRAHTLATKVERHFRTVIVIKTRC